ncbi:MAG TPA: peptidoglycan DD-metalloendopeptidase family protein [Candidatus Fermentibacter daniensis]|nr:peptidoglycan DD-metalloendopeptidase family protein [Candidatus Fermentibacter daniensis]HOZ16936.1 peptidoglycan DD-metalloendopeptidase family protein [Candidatus Fermentibacter daniensis]HPH38651.1 peptidoglycan DD-metalloendopeptidase family protein [Candidatus Fermentibacter daniensis]HPN61880.1 peptidoglycan DD-metalloendopeptidase family protein [Candidatus Fermentibacter daniensis]HQM40706.1 peptidoglycan DD-metalloendopeptidase family protein [Candidatus Fermentibacter daniensis]
MLHLVLAILTVTGDARLDSLGNRLEETRLRVSVLESRHAAVSDILVAIHDNLLAARAFYAGLQDEEARLLGDIETMDIRCAAGESLQSALSASLSEYLVYVYSHRNLLGPEALFCRGGLSRMLRREAYLEFLARRAASEQREIRRETDSLSHFRDSLRNARTEVAALQRQMEDIQNRIIFEEGRQALLRLQLGGELARARDSSAILERERQRVSSLVSDLQAASTTVAASLHIERPTAESVIGNSAGSLEWPADGTVVRRFGLEVHPVYGTETTCDGISVSTPPATAVHAVSDGRVLYAREFLSMGRLVVVDHLDGYFTVYGNLGSIEVNPGDMLTAGDEIGVTGSLAGGVSGYYFEIRAGGQPVDPEGFLR